MAYTIPTFDELRTGLLRDLKNLLPDAATDEDSDLYVRATMLASALEGLYQHQLWIARQLLPDTADDEYVVRHALLRGLSLKAATKAAGTLVCTGEVDAAIPAGQAVTHAASGQVFVTTVAGQIGAGGTATVPCEAATAGAMADLAGASVLFVAAPAGVQSQAVVTISGGSDTETIASLLARLLEYMRSPPGGGSAADYVRWALSVEGVTGAWCFPGRRGTGTVDVACVTSEGLPSVEVLAAVQAYIDEMRPVACKSALAIAPTVLPVDVAVAVRPDTGSTLPLLTTRIQDAVGAYLAGLEPGSIVYRSRIEAIVSDVSGVADRALTAPAANVQALVDATHVQWPRLGTVTVTAL